MSSEKFEYKTRGERVRLLRENLGLTQAKFALKIRRTKGIVSSIESGRIPLSSDVRLAICNVFAVRKDWLELGEGEMYDDRWSLLEERAKELGEDIYYKLILAKVGEQAHNELFEKLRQRQVSGREKEYLDKLFEIFRHKDEGTISAITQNIDTFLRVPSEEMPPAGETPQKKRKTGSEG